MKRIMDLPVSGPLPSPGPSYHQTPIPLPANVLPRRTPVPLPNNVRHLLKQNTNSTQSKDRGAKPSQSDKRSRERVIGDGGHLHNVGRPGSSMRHTEAQKTTSPDWEDLEEAEALLARFKGGIGQSVVTAETPRTQVMTSKGHKRPGSPDLGPGRGFKSKKMSKESNPAAAQSIDFSGDTDIGSNPIGVNDNFPLGPGVPSGSKMPKEKPAVQVISLLDEDEPSIAEVPRPPPTQPSIKASIEDNSFSSNRKEGIGRERPSNINPTYHPSVRPVLPASGGIARSSLAITNVSGPVATHPPSSSVSLQANAADIVSDVVASSPRGSQPGHADQSSPSTAQIMRTKKVWVSHSPKGVPFTPEEDSLILHLKEDLKLPWADIAKYFPNRGWPPLQTRYSKTLRTTKSEREGRLLGMQNPAPGPGRKRRQLSSGDELARSRSTSAGARSTRPRPSYVFKWPEVLDQDDDNNPIESDDVASEKQHSSWEEKPSSWSIDEKLIVSTEEFEARTELLAAQLPVSMMFPEGPSSTSRQFFYLSWSEREKLRNGLKNGEWDPQELTKWQCKPIHIDFQAEEMEVIERVMIDTLRPAELFEHHSHRTRIRKLLKSAAESKILQIAWEASKLLTFRSRHSVESFLRDAIDNKLSKTPVFEVFGPVKARPPPNRQLPPASTLLRHRELGSTRFASDKLQPSRPLKNRLYDSIGPVVSFTGTSGDVNAVAWAPDGKTFAAGSTCLVDADSMQYNRPNNLVLGDVESRLLKELPDHHTLRTKTESGVNATHSMHVSQDPRLFASISAVAFSPEGDFMFSAGYDNVVRIWDVGKGVFDARHRSSLKHKEPVDVLAIHSTGLFATGCRRTGKRAVKLVSYNPENPSDAQHRSFSSPKSIEKPESEIFPSSLRFDPDDGRYLLASFAPNGKERGRDPTGEICMWEIETGVPVHVVGNARHVFDCTWNRRRGASAPFAAGCMANGAVNRGTRSTVRIYDWRQRGVQYGLTMELECRAADMNDVIFCPHDDNLISASCTDGKTYLWDVRQPNEVLHVLSHGKPVMEFDEEQSRDLLDTGVRFCSWGENRDRLYTGSSDGVVKVWDVNRSSDDVHVKDLVTLNSGVMSGAFSHDYTSLLLGEVNSSVSVFQVGREDCTLRDMASFDFIPAHGGDVQGLDETEPEDPAPTDTGISAANELLGTHQMVIRPLGGLPIRQAVQGHAYQGPYDNAKDAVRLRAEAVEFQAAIQRPAGEQCDISMCKELGALKITEEEAGDSGRSADRIPDTLRRARKEAAMCKAGLQEAPRIRQGMVKCSRCGGAARPRLHDGNDDGVEILCERCDFACLRCGSSGVKVKDDSKLYCRSCGSGWSVDVLGYSPIEDRANRRRLRMRKDRNVASALQDALNRAGQRGDHADGDETNDLLSYYHGLWTDRPPSPL